ncbi:MAG TPA: ABC transporter permease [Blastocatellia bacterium]|nr:ABC transporter permease [Blastocatellia bacterium]
MTQDLLYGVRVLRRRPGITAIAVVTLALGISANTAIFSVAYASILRPLPFPRQEQLVVAWKSDQTARNPFVELSVPEFKDWQTDIHVFDSIAAMPTTVYGYGYVMTGFGEPVQLESARVSADFFKTLGVSPLLGRLFVEEDDHPGAARVVILSHRLWRERFYSDPGIVGQLITLGQLDFTIIGVMSRDFEFPRGADIWTPLLSTMNPRIAENRGAVFLQAIGRLKHGVSTEQAEAELNTIIARVAEAHPETESSGHRVVVTPLADYVFGSARPGLLLLLAATGLLLLIACVNIANLLLARALSRRRELAVRTALGASRMRLVRQFVTESLPLMLSATTLGIILAFWLIDFLLWAAPEDIPRIQDVRINLVVLLFTSGITLLTTFCVGLVPALASSRVSLTEGLNDGGNRISGERTGGKLRSVLVVVEVAMSFLLLAGAALTVRTFQNLSRVSLGFDPHNVLTFQLSLQGESYRDRERRREFFKQYLGRLEEEPGVIAAGAVTVRPLEGTIGWDVPFAFEGQSVQEAQRNPVPNYESISPHYFRALGMPLKSGREFTEEDNDKSPDVVIISESMASSFFGPGVDPIGKRVRSDFTDPAAPWRTIVGVAADARYRELKDVRWDVYAPYRQSNAPIRYVVIRTVSNPAAFADTARKTLASLDPKQAVTGLNTMNELVDRNLARPRFNSLLLVWLAGLGILLGAVGIYGVISYSVTQRTHEIGIRMAMGAQTKDVLSMVMKQGFVLSAFGAGAGLIASLVLTRLMGSLLFGVSATDPFMFFGIGLLLIVVALMASYVPARRAARVDPMVSLRSQ